MKRVFAIACVVLLAGCDDKEKNFKNVTDLNLKQPLDAQTFNATSGQNGLQLLSPANSHFCFLTRVTGNFQGGAQSVRLDIDSAAQGGPRWRLVAQAQSPGGVSAQAICVPKFKFATAVNSQTAMAAKPAGKTGVIPSVGCNTSGGELLGGVQGRTIFLSGMAGAFNGDAEATAVVRSKPDTALLKTRACSGAGTTGFAMQYALRPDGGQIRYFSAKGVTTDPKAATFSSAVAVGEEPHWTDDWYELLTPLPPPDLDPGGFAPQLSAPVTLAPVDQAVCGLVAVAGKFRGGAEFAQITQVNGNWVLQTQSQAANSRLLAAARCVLRDQRDPT